MLHNQLMEFDHSTKSTRQNPELKVLGLSPMEARVAAAGLHMSFQSKTREEHPWRVKLMYGASTPTVIKSLCHYALERQISKDPELRMYEKLRAVAVARNGNIVLSGEEANIAAKAIHRMAEIGAPGFDVETQQAAEAMDDQLTESYPVQA
jgi:hypothetical protein